MPNFISRRLLFTSLLLSVLVCSHSLQAFTKNGSIYTTDGSQADVSAAIANASVGDTVLIPAGSFTWGAGGTFVSVNKAITLAGAGEGLTTINISPTAGTFGNAVIRISAAAIVRNFTATQPGTASTSAFVTSTTNGWRITNITYNSANTVGYFVSANSYGLIDNCTLNTTFGSDEPILARGPSDSWQTPSSMGTADAVFIENCTINGPGYVCDFNSNSRGVVRFCTITGTSKVDGHGLASNTPARGVRHMEVYGNLWTGVAGFWTAIHMRGGTGMVFGNVSDNVGGTGVKHPFLVFDEYGSLNTWGNFLSTFQTPTNYPINDQIGVGMDPKVGGSEPFYIWNNFRGGEDWGMQWSNIPDGAITQHRTNTGDAEATFTMEDIIAADRDYFKHTFGADFTGAGGVGLGTKAQMLAITPTKEGVGFWVTNEASWNTTLPENTSGQLYIWDGADWVLSYTPYTYPHPLRRPPAPANPQLSL